MKENIWWCTTLKEILSASCIFQFTTIPVIWTTTNKWWIKNDVIKSYISERVEHSLSKCDISRYTKTRLCGWPRQCRTSYCSSCWSVAVCWRAPWKELFTMWPRFGMKSPKQTYVQYSISFEYQIRMLPHLNTF